MNRILFRPDEIDAEGRVTFGGERAAHVLDFLHGEIGQVLKTGVYDGLIGTSVIEAIDARNGESSSAKATEDKRGTGNGERTVTVKTDHLDASLAPCVDLILAMPRPRVFKRMLPQITAMGLGNLYVVGAEKVEKSYWSAGCLTEKEYRPYLEEGLMQSGTSAVPRIILEKNLRRFLEKLDVSDYKAAFIAHPYSEPATMEGANPEGRTLIAVGPEGGWTDEEIELFASRGFAKHSLGRRILKTETASIALIATLVR